jgi:hypothetical protein
VGPHWRFAEQSVCVVLVWEQAHCWRRLSHPYLVTPGTIGSGHVAQRMGSTEPGVGLHVLEATHENMEF